MNCCKKEFQLIRDELVLSLLDDFKLHFPNFNQTCDSLSQQNASIFNKIVCDLNLMKTKTKSESVVPKVTHFDGLPLWLVCIISLILFVLPLVIYILMKRINYNKSNCSNRQN